MSNIGAQLGGASWSISCRAFLADCYKRRSRPHLDVYHRRRSKLAASPRGESLTTVRQATLIFLLFKCRLHLAYKRLSLQLLLTVRAYPAGAAGPEDHRGRSCIMPQSIEELLKESKELIERSRKLRARSQQAMKQFIDVTKCSDSLSDSARKPCDTLMIHAEKSCCPSKVPWYFARARPGAPLIGVCHPLSPCRVVVGFGATYLS